MERKMIYKCNCGFTKTYFKGIQCRVCGAAATKEYRIASYTPVVPIKYKNFDDASKVLDISAKYAAEISKAYRLIDSYRSIISDALKDITTEYVNKINNLEKILRETRQKRDYYKVVLANASNDALANTANEIDDYIQQINTTIASIKDEMIQVRLKYNEDYNKAASNIPEYKILSKLVEIKDYYCDRINADQRNYGEYIECVYNVAINHDKKWLNAFYEEADRISDEDDKYLSDICPDYKGKHHYMLIANAVQRRMNNRVRMEELSRGMTIHLDPLPAIDIDPYSRRSSRVCYEAYIRDVIAALDESICGTKM